jgi:Bacterial Ig-like domain/RTX calcium-binding nonapeptide repeat (4 copies)
MSSIPLSWNDPMFSNVTNSGPVVVKNGGTVSNKSISDNSDAISIVSGGSFTVDTVRVDSREAVRVGGPGDININNSYLETTGLSGDHADGIQAYSPNSRGNINITNSAIVSHNQNATAGLWVADNYGGTVTLNNVMFEGGPYGLRLAADSQDISVALKDVYFVGPFEYGPLLFQANSSPIHITEWDNVRYATIVNGELVPGALIPPPWAVEGGGSAPTTPTQPTTPGAPSIASFSNDSGVTGDHITNDNTVTLTGKAAANSTVKVFDGTTQIGTATTNSSGAWSYTTAALKDGSHSLTAKATTASGATSAASAALALKIDTTAPTAPTMATSTASAATAAKAAAAAANTVTLTGTAEANSTVKVFDGSTQIGTATANNSGAWTYTTGALASGNHSLTSKAMDAAGNTGTASKAVAVNIPSTGNPGSGDPGTGNPGSGNPGSGNPGTPSTPGAPKIVSFSNDTGVKGDGITSDNTLTLTGTAAANAKVAVFDGAKQIGTATANSSGAWHYTTTALADGAHNLTTKVGTSTSSAALAVKIDTHAPDAPKIASFSSDGKAVSGGALHTDHVTLTGTAEANSVVKVFDGTKQIGTATTNDKGAWTYAADNLADGKHSLTSTASDAAGNVSKASAAVSLNVDTHNGNGGHTADSAFTGVHQHWNDTVTFKGTADPYSQITIFDNGKGSVGTVKADKDGAWSLSTKSAVSDTVHNFTTKVVDSDGHSSTASGSAILGTNHSDTLKGTSGNDLFSGNGGRDTFVFAPNFGKDVIKDFQEAGRSHDVVQFSKSVFDNFADVLSHASQSGHDVVINAGSGHTLTLKDTKLASLDKYDFHFA